MTEVMFDINYFPTLINALRVLITINKQPEIELGIESRDGKIIHLITVKIETIQIANFRASLSDQDKTRKQRELLIRVYGRCYAKELRGKDPYASIELEYNVFKFEGEVKVRTSGRRR